MSTMEAGKVTKNAKTFVFHRKQRHTSWAPKISRRSSKSEQSWMKTSQTFGCHEQENMTKCQPWPHLQLRRNLLVLLKKNNMVKKQCSLKRLLERDEHKSSRCSRSIWKAWLEQRLYQYADIILRKTLNIWKCFNPRRKDFRQLINLCVSDAQAKKRLWGRDATEYCSREGH